MAACSSLKMATVYGVPNTIPGAMGSTKWAGCAIWSPAPVRLPTSPCLPMRVLTLNSGSGLEGPSAQGEANVFHRLSVELRFSPNVVRSVPSASVVRSGSAAEEYHEREQQLVAQELLQGRLSPLSGRRWTPTHMSSTTKCQALLHTQVSWVHRHRKALHM